MSKVKQKIQAEGLAKPQPLVRELIRKYTPLPPSAKDQFFYLRLTAINEAGNDGTAND